MSIAMTDLKIDATIPLWALITCIFALGGGWYLIQKNSESVDNLNKTMILVNQTMARIDERTIIESRKVDDHEKKLTDHESRISTLEGVVRK